MRKPRELVYFVESLLKCFILVLFCLPRQNTARIVQRWWRHGGTSANYNTSNQPGHVVATITGNATLRISGCQTRWQRQPSRGHVRYSSQVWFTGVKWVRSFAPLRVRYSSQVWNETSLFHLYSGSQVLRSTNLSSTTGSAVVSPVSVQWC